MPSLTEQPAPLTKADIKARRRDDCRYAALIRRYFGSPYIGSREDDGVIRSCVKSAIRVFGKRSMDGKEIDLPARWKLEQYITGHYRLPVCPNYTLSAHRRNHETVYAVPTAGHLAERYIVVRFDADAHNGQTDAADLIQWVSQKWFNGLIYAEPSKGGHSGYIAIRIPPYTGFQYDISGKGIEPVRPGDCITSPITPSARKINAMLNHVEQAIKRLAQQAGFKSTIELKGRYTTTSRDENGERQLDYYGDAVKLPRCPTTADLDTLTAATTDDAPLWAILKAAGETDLSWSNIGRKPTPAIPTEPTPATTTDQKAKIAALIAGCDEDDDDDDMTGGTPAKGTGIDALTLIDTTADYMKRIAAVSRIALRQAKGDVEKALPIALTLGSEEHGGPFTGPTHPARITLIRSSIHRAQRTFKVAKMGKGSRGGKQSGPWFDRDADPTTMIVSQSGMVSNELLKAINKQYPHARLTRKKLARVTVLLQRSITSGNLTEVTTAGLKNLALHERVQFEGINGSAIAAAKAILITTGQIVRTRRHWHGEGKRGKCEAFVLGPRAIVQPWLKPFITGEIQPAGGMIVPSLSKSVLGSLTSIATSRPVQFQQVTERLMSSSQQNPAYWAYCGVN